ncbi:MAG: protein O-mannosyl-transferase family, partial [Syntrophothermus sp.]
VLIAFLIGLAIGVHLLNLLVIPATCFVYYFKKYKPTRAGMLITFALSIVILAFVMYVIIPWVVRLSGLFELLFVNSFGLPFNSGTVVYFLLLIGGLVWGLIYTRRKGKTVLNTVILSMTFILIGYSSFIMLIIRANADTPINENAPKDAIGLLSYLNREQYGDFPIFYGQFYNAPIVDYKDGNPVYVKDAESGKYIIIDDRKQSIPVYDSRFTTIFPRMWSNQRKGAEKFYHDWGGEGVPITITDQDGTTKTINRPTFGENLKYFFSYQVKFMYLRYFLWNFSGRQNDVQGYGGIENGNWITGIPFIDKMMLGHAVTDLPDSMKNRATNKYFMLPLLLGLIGFFYHIKNDGKGTIVVALLFIMTGLAIVVYLNQQPYEPRERDYAYAGSFYAFAIWIGLGVIAIINYLNKYLKKEMVSIAVVTVATLVLVPGIMAEQNWDDHTRAGRYSCRDYAANYLNSCDKNAILFTNGDNDTFPLWYDQEVEGIRTDTRVVNLMLASGSWYIDQMYKKAYESEPLPFSMPQKMYRPGSNDMIFFYESNIQGYTELKDLVEFIKSDNENTFVRLQNGERYKFFPTKKVKITVDKEAVVRNGIVPAYLKDKIVDSICWTIRSNQLFKNDIMLLDMVATNNWKRPMYFAAPSSVAHCFNVDSFCLVQGWVYKFMPVKADPADYINGMGGIDERATYDMIMNKGKWGNLSDPKVYIDPESLNNSIRPKTNILRAAQALVRKNQKDSANKLMDVFFREFPDSKIPYDIYVLPFAELYYKTGQDSKANAIIKRITQVITQNLDYYYSFEGTRRNYFQDDIDNSLGMLRRMQMVTADNKQGDLSKEIENTFKLEFSKYSK